MLLFWTENRLVSRNTTLPTERLTGLVGFSFKETKQNTRPVKSNLSLISGNYKSSPWSLLQKSIKCHCNGSQKGFLYLFFVNCDLILHHSQDSCKLGCTLGHTALLVQERSTLCWKIFVFLHLTSPDIVNGKARGSCHSIHHHKALLKKLTK